MKKQTKRSIRSLIAVSFLPLSCLSSTQAAITIDINQSGADVLIVVNGSVITGTPASGLKVTALGGGGGQWLGDFAGADTNPMTIATATDAVTSPRAGGGMPALGLREYFVDNITDTGRMSQITAMNGPAANVQNGILENVTGAVFGVGATDPSLDRVLLGGNDGNLMPSSDNYTDGTVLGYTLRFSNVTLAEFGLVEGDARTVTFTPNGTGAGGAVQSISWAVGSVAAIPEPSGILLVASGLGFVAFRRKR